MYQLAHPGTQHPDLTLLIIAAIVAFGFGLVAGLHLQDRLLTGTPAHGVE